MRHGAISEPRIVHRRVRIREQAHRRGVLIAMGALIVFSTSPVFGHHVAERADVLLAGSDHLLGVCLIALHALMEPVHLTFHILLTAGLAYAVWDRARAWNALRRALALLGWETPAPDGPLGRAAVDIGLPLARIREVEGLSNPAFTAGWWAPKVYMSSALVRFLDPDELAAVLAHEAAHVARRDPLRLSVLRFLACTLFYLPALRRLADDAADEAEIAADDVAVTTDRVQSPLALASAILKIVLHWGRAPDRADHPTLGAGGAIVGFQSEDLLERRIRRLMGEDAAVGTHVTRWSLAGAAGVLAAVWLSGLMMAHPLRPGVEIAASPATMSGDVAAAHPSRGSRDGTHCEHRRTVALTHLFCLGFGARPSGSPCPHTVAQHGRPTGGRRNPTTG